MAARHGHFMPKGLLHSQFEALEEPGRDENAITVSIEPRQRAIVEDILARLGLCAAPGQFAKAGTG